MAALDRARSAAFAAGDPARLAEVYPVGSPALRRDRTVLERLTAAGLRAQGLSLQARRVAVTTQAPGRTTLAVTDVMPGYRLVDRDGAVVEQRSGRGARTWTVVLVRGAGGWRVYDVLRG